jgi:hypothetical protein
VTFKEKPVEIFTFESLLINLAEIFQKIGKETITKVELRINLRWANTDNRTSLLTKYNSSDYLTMSPPHDNHLYGEESEKKIISRRKETIWQPKIIVDMFYSLGNFTNSMVKPIAPF